MQSDFSPSPSIESIQVNNGVVALTGYGLDVRVDRGRLCLSDGIADQRREAQFTKATCGIDRLVLLGHSGTVSLEALRWLHDIGAGIFQIDADGIVILASSPPKTDNVHLRRAQAMAADTETGLQIIRALLTTKVEGQARVAEQIGSEDDAQAIRAQIPSLKEETDIASIRIIEAQAASAYWNLWSDIPVHFVRKDEKSIPPHWKKFQQRKSPLSKSQRNAANPANAMLNYLYAILEAETRIAILQMGLDPGMGFLHQDLKNRDSLALDVMEAVRPEVDAWLLDFLDHSYFERKDFFERRDGTVRISSRVTALLAQTSPTWARAVAPQVEWGAKLLNRTRKGRTERNISTPLTGTNRSKGRSNKMRATSKGTNGQKINFKKCRQCGKPAVWKRGKYCSRKCFEKDQQEVLQPKFKISGPSKLRKLRSAGEDPAHGGKAARKRGVAIAEWTKRRAEWEKIHGSGDRERELFLKEIQPHLSKFSLSKIVSATGLSKRYAALIRDGKLIPHPVHNRNLLSLLEREFIVDAHRYWS